MKKISLNNGLSHMTALEAIAELYNPNSSFCGSWESIVQRMDDEAREAALDSAIYPDCCTERQEQEIFLAAYLAVAPSDLTIG